MLSYLLKGWHIYRDDGASELWRKGLKYLNWKQTQFNMAFHRNFEEQAFDGFGNPQGENIFNQDWDNLIILDACRYQEFSEVITDTGITGELEHRESLGSSTREFISANFIGRHLHDVVVVSGNLWYDAVQLDHDFEDQFRTELDVHDLFLVDKFDPSELTEHQQEKLALKDGLWSLPEFVMEKARAANEYYPNKRLLIHFHQPHTPMIGETGQKYHDESHPMNVAEHALETAYRENIEIVLDHVEQLLPELEGKTVISADHGEMLNDWDYPFPMRRYRHPPENYHPKLVKVPWYIVDHETRKRVVPEQPREQEMENEVEELHDRLEQLGYKR